MIPPGPKPPKPTRWLVESFTGGFGSLSHSVVEADTAQEAARDAENHFQIHGCAKVVVSRIADEGETFSINASIEFVPRQP